MIRRLFSVWTKYTEWRIYCAEASRLGELIVIYTMRILHGFQF